MKQILKYILIVLLFIVVVGGITYSYLQVHYKENGSVEIIKNYYDIIFSNIFIEDNKTTVKIDNDEDFVHIEIPNLDEIKKTTISIDVTNIGNVNAVLDNFSISNINTNSNTGETNVDVSIKKGDIVKGGESKKIDIIVSYTGNSKEVYYNFNINYVFDEVAL